MRLCLFSLVLLVACGEDDKPGEESETTEEAGNTSVLEIEAQGTDTTDEGGSEGELTGMWSGDCEMVDPTQSATVDITDITLDLDLRESASGKLSGAGYWNQDYQYYMGQTNASSTAYGFEVQLSGQRTGDTLVMDMTQVYSGGTDPYSFPSYLEFEWDGADSLVGGIMWEYDGEVTSDITCSLTR